jgi:hypothetical protein
VTELKQLLDFPTSWTCDRSPPTAAGRPTSSTWANSFWMKYLRVFPTKGLSPGMLDPRLMVPRRLPQIEPVESLCPGQWKHNKPTSLSERRKADSSLPVDWQTDLNRRGPSTVHGQATALNACCRIGGRSGCSLSMKSRGRTGVTRTPPSARWNGPWSLTVRGNGTGLLSAERLTVRATLWSEAGSLVSLMATSAAVTDEPIFAPAGC